MDAQIVARVKEAKFDMQKSENLIMDYKPFILSEASKASKSSIDESCDEFSIGMIAFHEAVRNYNETKGTFIAFASTIIRNRIYDFYRKESRHLNHHSIDDHTEENEPLIAQIADKKNHYEDRDNLEATKLEIRELVQTLQKYNLQLTDIAENSPKQERTLTQCRLVIQYMIDHPILFDDSLKKGTLPVTLLAKKTKVSKKLIERHRKYILALIIIHSNGFFIIRDHIKGVLNLRKEVAE